jgi:glycosyltransferase involved in cell wall biosynthesis
VDAEQAPDVTARRPVPNGAGPGAIFVLPAAVPGASRPTASWVSTWGWAAAAERVIGNAWIVDGGGVVDLDEARRRAARPGPRSQPRSAWRELVPVVLKTAYKDGRRWARARRFAVDAVGPWSGRDVAFVWQRHELFERGGLELARRLGVPGVLFVPATLVWEAAQWGVRRPGWGSWLERAGERPAVCGADLVACGSDLVAEQAERIGADPERILVTPTGVDLERFASGRRRDVRGLLGIESSFVVGWVGSFRGFHAAEQAVLAARAVPGATLLMVGDGPERPRVERLADEVGVRAVFTGTVAHDDVPDHLAAMDVAILLATPGQAFHYSPLKLAEYLAAGLPVVAPNVGDLPSRLTDGTDAVLVAPGEVEALAAALRRLQSDPAQRARIGQNGRELAIRSWSWDLQVRRTLTALGR